MKLIAARRGSGRERPETAKADALAAAWPARATAHDTARPALRNERPRPAKADALAAVHRARIQLERGVGGKP